MAEFFRNDQYWLVAAPKVATTSIKYHAIDSKIWFSFGGKLKKNHLPIYWIVRHPVSRIISAWNSTIQTQAAWKRTNDIVTDWEPHAKYVGDFDYFKEFLEENIHLLHMNWDLHWSQQHLYLEEINVDPSEIAKVIPVEKLAKFIPNIPFKYVTEWKYSISRKKAIEILSPIVLPYYQRDLEVYEQAVRDYE